jgi:hypothetical protein
MHATIEHPGWRVATAPVGFAAAFAILGVGIRHLAPGQSALGYLTLLGIALYLVAWVFLFYSSPRRIEVHDDTVIATFFGGREETHRVGSLKRPARPNALGTIFDLTELEDETGRVRVRVWKDMEGWNELVGAIEAHVPTA